MWPGCDVPASDAPLGPTCACWWLHLGRQVCGTPSAERPRPHLVELLQGSRGLRVFLSRRNVCFHAVTSLTGGRRFLQELELEPSVARLHGICPPSAGDRVFVLAAGPSRWVSGPGWPRREKAFTSGHPPTLPASGTPVATHSLRKAKALTQDKQPGKVRLRVVSAMTNI